ncbi:N-(5'-phosphoribosyl)anthranilate isomerase [Sporosarcina sp. P37]|uniref:phosphoribosylanthranilate isomerase n=1 Tax=unclassified Sporosarcina TaxID=2647733 RepID=UPI000A1797F2|nr:MULTISPECIES: phosphoribosylanthranilate isomerase [unclassified Sporosarcina]ARK24724.1 N-(5'-phosphoribosyl)anthranilate isomerase [Sporosarcina sp. P37]PID19881.1 phosphoribosylanthranilate isomerase [Sporosarcina sp. P35]
MTIKVKICGLTQPEHVRAAVEAGADAIGFVFAPSRREVTVEQAQELAKHIPDSVWKIGVFTDASMEQLHRTFKEVSLDYIQYHGDETPAFIQEVGLPSIKALAVENEEDAARAASYDVDYYLFDTPGVEYKGGSGKTFDWSLLENAGVSKEQIILAGGLHARNVQEAVRQVNPYMVDVSSGVEIEKQKDTERIRTFIHTAKGRRNQDDNRN